jgi:uncharacterized protein (TIGR03435 family)
VIAVPIAIGLTSSPAAVAQTTADTGSTARAFDSVSIAKPATGGPLIWNDLRGGTLSTTRLPIREVIAVAYGVDKQFVTGGPDWLDQPLYSISARTTDPAVTKSLTKGPPVSNPMAPMIRGLLATRFGLSAHIETQQLPAYALRVDAGGSKLNPALLRADGQEGPPMVKFTPNFLIADSTDLKALTQFLTRKLGRMVVDETGLKGRYDYALAGLLDAESLPKTLREQLGLTIEPITAPVDLVVVDSVQAPTLDAAPPATS